MFYQTSLNPKNQTVVVELFNSEGTTLALLLAPVELSTQLNTTLTLSIVEKVPSSQSDQLESSVVEITLVNDQNTSVTELDYPLTICLPRSTSKGVKSRDICLSFFDTEESEWRCQDECLIERGDLLCGQTDHLTDYALFLSGTGQGSHKGNKCGSDSASGDDSIFWASFGMILGASFIVCLCVVANESLIYWKHRRQHDLVLATGKISPSKSLAAPSQ